MGMVAPLVKDPVARVQCSGFYRFLGYMRHQTEVFPNNSGKRVAIASGDFFREPMLMARLGLVNEEGLSFGASLMVNSLYKGPAFENAGVTLDLGINTQMEFQRGWGKLVLKTGGVSWYRQSRLTVWGNRSFNRMSLFDRRPQHAVHDAPMDHYTQYVENGLMDMGVRYGSRAFQGVFLSATQLPGDVKVKGVIGKSNFNRSFSEYRDNFTGTFRVSKEMSPKHRLAVNALRSSADIDSTGSETRRYFVHTAEWKHDRENVVILAEGGLGRYAEGERSMGLGEAVFLDVRPKAQSRFPLGVRVYRISPQFVNVTGNFLNTSVLEVFPNVQGIGATVRSPFQSPMMGLGSPVNNRQGLEVNAHGRWAGWDVNGGVGVSSELEATEGGLSYYHHVNGETISRLYLFGQGWGPYNTISSVYRRSFEEVALTDTTQLASTGMNLKKRFNTLELQAKKQGQVLEKKFVFLALHRVNTAQREWLGLGQGWSQNFLTQTSTQFDWMVEVGPKTVLLAHAALERILGNHETDMGDAPEGSSTSVLRSVLGLERTEDVNEARNQRSSRMGVGLDVTLAPQMHLYLRHQWYRFVDPNFLDNKLRGTETMLELKMSF